MLFRVPGQDFLLRSRLGLMGGDPDGHASEVAVARWFATHSYLTHVRTRHRSPHTNRSQPVIRVPELDIAPPPL